MEQDMYFWCQSGEDGTSITPMTRKELEARLAESVEEGSSHEFLGCIPDEDKGCWQVDPESVVIIKGRIIQPQPEEKVTKFKLP